jgi:DNA-binding CsgD family transcriptional regulator/tetratricopeptide (TPR) repeat protein
MPELDRLRDPAAPGALVGRASELGLLAASLDLAHGGSPQVVGIEGAAGIGKTSLIRHFVAGAAASAVVWASGDPDETDLPWGVLRQLSAAATAAGVPGAGDLGRLIEGLDPGADPLMVGTGLLRLLEADDIVVVIDDAHWADAQSLAAVRFALRRLVSEKVMVIVTYRPEDAGRLGEGWRRLLEGSGTGTRVRLGGLAAPDLAQLAEGVAGRALSERGAARLLEQTAGHPLYARSLLEQVPLATLERTSGPLPAPVDLASAVAARYASIRQPAQELVAAAAVLGRRCTVADMYALSGVQDSGEALAEAVEVGLLAEMAGAESAEVDFPHVLVRSAIYHDLSPGRRRRLHARAASVTSGRAALGHRFAAATGPDPELAEDLERDARSELAARRLAAGGQQLARAAQLTPPGALRQARQLSAVEALLVAGEMTSAAELAWEPGSIEGGPWADYVSGYLALLSAQPDTAETLLTRAWETSKDVSNPPGAPADLRARIASQLAILAIVRVDYPAMLRFGEAAVAAGAAEGWVATFAWFARIIGLALAGRIGEARALLGSLDAPGGPAGLEGLAARGMIRLWTDDPAGAYEDLSEILRRAEAGEPLRISQVTVYLGEAALRLGRLDEAVIHTELAVVQAVDSGWVWDFPILYGLAACPRALRGDWAEAEAHAKTAAEWAAIIGTRSARAYAAQAGVYLAKCRDDMAALERAARDFVASYDSLEPGTHLLGPVLAEALANLGRTAEARAALEDFRPMAEAAGRLSALMAVARADAQLAAAAGDWDGARALFQQAIDAGHELGMPLAVAETQLAYGRAALRSGTRKEAVHLLTTALRTCQVLGAAAYAAIASRELSELGMAELDSMTPGTELLTSTEGAVATLVAVRLSNQEVAQRLMMSVKTVEYHLTHIYAKLGVASRRELADRLGRAAATLTAP